MANYKTKKAGGNSRIALWQENLGKKQFFFPICAMSAVFQCVQQNKTIYL